MANSRGIAVPSSLFRHDAQPYVEPAAKTGFLWKQSGNNKEGTWKYREVRLRGTQLFYSTFVHSDFPNTPCGIIDLRGAKLITSTQKIGVHGFTLVAPRSYTRRRIHLNKKFAFLALDEADWLAWTQLIAKHIANAGKAVDIHSGNDSHRVHLSDAVDWTLLLPDELILDIFARLFDFRDLLSCERVCHRWRRIAHDTALWKLLCLRHHSAGCALPSEQTWREVYLEHQRLLSVDMAEYPLPPLCWRKESDARQRPKLKYTIVRCQSYRQRWRTHHAWQAILGAVPALAAMSPLASDGYCCSCFHGSVEHTRHRQAECQRWEGDQAIGTENSGELTDNDEGLRRVEVDGRTVVVDIALEAGMEHYTVLRDYRIQAAHGCIVAFDVTRKSTLRAIKSTVKKIRRVKYDRNIPIVIVADQSNTVYKERKIDIAEARKLASDLRCKIIEISARQGFRVDEMLVNTVRLIALYEGHAVPVGMEPCAPKQHTKKPLWSIRRLLRRFSRKAILKSCS